MNENEKNLFYSVLNNRITEEPTRELTSNIMRIVHQKVHQKTKTNKILAVLGYVLLGFFTVGFLCVYLYFFTDFKLPAFHFSFKMPARFYIIIISIIFAFSLIDLYFRKRLYENG
jgi:hypothetical protein